MGEEYRYCDPCRDGGEPHRESRRHHDDCCEPPCNPCEPCGDKDDNDWDWGSWLPILVIVFILCGGLGWFNGSGSCKEDPCDGGGSSSWLLILLVIFLIWQGQGDGKKGGFLGGLF